MTFFESANFHFFVDKEKKLSHPHENQFYGWDSIFMINNWLPVQNLLCKYVQYSVQCRYNVISSGNSNAAKFFDSFILGSQHPVLMSENSGVNFSLLLL